MLNLYRPPPSPSYFDPTRNTTLFVYKQKLAKQDSNAYKQYKDKICGLRVHMNVYLNVFINKFSVENLSLSFRLPSLDKFMDMCENHTVYWNITSSSPLVSLDWVRA